MKTFVKVRRGPMRGRVGWIAGDFADRARRGVTKAIFHPAGDECELLLVADLELFEQLSLDLPETKKPAANIQVRSGLDARYSFAASAVQKLHDTHDCADDNANERYSSRNLRSKPQDPFGLDQ